MGKVEIGEKMKWRLLLRSLKFWWQRRTRGWDDSETWNLDESFAKLILPRLKRYEELSGTPEGWKDIMWTFEYLANGDGYMTCKEDEEKIQKGLDLFAKHYRGLWW